MQGEAGQAGDAGKITHVLPSGYGTATPLLHALARRFKTRPECTLRCSECARTVDTLII